VEGGGGFVVVVVEGCVLEAVLELRLSVEDLERIAFERFS
jgi:hypothetical protein